MSLEKWLDQQGFPHGFECIGIERMQQVWDAAQKEERESCANICETESEIAEEMGHDRFARYSAEMASKIRMRSKE